MPRLPAQSRAIRVGQRYGRWVVIEEPFRDHRDQYRCRCRCDCGVERSPNIYQLASGTSPSCGCLTRDRNTKHGQFDAPEYSVWSSMKTRCLNPKTRQYADYGGRGITICPEWLNDFAQFLADMGPRPENTRTREWSLERRDNDGPYCPANCYWATRWQQDNNKRTSRVLEFRGRRLTATQWARELGWSRALICGRLALGWSIERTLTTPPRRRHVPALEISGGQSPA